MGTATFTAFGMTRRPGRSVENDPGLAALFDADAKAICLVGKTWDFHVKVALEISLDENLELIRDSVAEVAKREREPLFDAEHFFDGYKANPGYAMDCLKAAHDAGARWLVLCDTNGGTLPDEVERIVAKVAETIPDTKLGIHAHNDTENAVANSLAAVRAGARQIQGTINGLGERCGNANLISLIPIAGPEADLSRSRRYRHLRGGFEEADRPVAPVGRNLEPRARPATPPMSAPRPSRIRAGCMSRRS